MPTLSPTRTLLTSTLATLLLAAGAPPVHASPVDLEAESLSLSTGAGQAVQDQAASGGKAALIWSTGAASGSLISRATRRIAVRARGELCDGAPRMIVSVDGKVVLDTTVSATGWTDYAGDLSLADGDHEVSVRFDNDYMAAGCDRNLLLDRIRLTSVAARPLPGAQLYVDPKSQARAQADAWRLSRPADASLLEKIASQPQAFWFGGWVSNVQSAVAATVGAAAAQGRVPVLVAYDIPQRDCGSYSAGGASSADAYRSWVRAFAAGIGDQRAIVVVEPDAVAGVDCLSAADAQTRYELLADAVRTLAARPATVVYLDGGHDAWQPVDVMAARLARAGMVDAQGFSLNVSNFRSHSGLVAYGQQLATAIGVAHFVIDTSRDGLGPASDGAWCNPTGRALGARPGTPGDYRLDWDLWVKRPGESDGACNGGPAAGAFWPDEALGLARRAAW